MAGQLEKFEMKPSLPGGGEAVDELGNSLDFLKFSNFQFFSWAFFWIQLAGGALVQRSTLLLNLERGLVILLLRIV